MNIGLVVSYLADQYGGPVAAVKCLGCELSTIGHAISYWATTAGHGFVKGIEGAHIYDVNWPSSWCRSKGLRRGLAAAISSLDILELNEFWLYPILAGSRAAKSGNVPYVLRPAGSLQSWALRRDPVKRFKKSLYLTLLGRSIMNRAACIRAASTLEAENIRKLGYNGPITIIPNGVDVGEFADVAGSEADLYWPEIRNRPCVLFMSRLSAEKGLDMLIPVWRDISRIRACKDALLVIAGPDCRGYQARVQAMLADPFFRSRVLVTGMVKGRQKAALLRRADVFVLPSYSENFGIVVAESLAFGTPVITTTGTPWQQLADIDAGRWIPPEAPALFQALREMLSMSSSQRRAMGSRGMDLVKRNYTWDEAARKFQSVCNCILQGKTVPFDHKV